MWLQAIIELFKEQMSVCAGAHNALNVCGMQIDNVHWKRKISSFLP